MVEKKESTKEADIDQSNDNQAQDEPKTNRLNDRNKVCGVVMPISGIGELTSSHWEDVRNIIDTSISDAGFTSNLVSNADEIGIIQKRIIQNLYDNPIVVCDVSCKNANVMFELGLRLAFDKPTIIIKDFETDYSFDTSLIEHLEYPRDLRFNQITAFQEKLTYKIKATYEKSLNENYSTFLKNFGTFEVAKLDEKTVSADQFILEKLNNIEDQLKFNSRVSNRSILYENIDSINSIKSDNDYHTWSVKSIENFKYPHNLKRDQFTKFKEILIQKFEKINLIKFKYDISYHPNYIFIEIDKKNLSLMEYAELKLSITSIVVETINQFDSLE